MTDAAGASERYMHHLTNFISRSPENEIFTLKDWLEALDEASLLELERVYERVLFQPADHVDLMDAIVLALGVARYEGGFAYRVGTKVYLRKTESGPNEDDTVLGTMYGVLLSEVLRREGIVLIRSISMVDGDHRLELADARDPTGAMHRFLEHTKVRRLLWTMQGNPRFQCSGPRHPAGR